MNLRLILMLILSVVLVACGGGGEGEKDDIVIQGSSGGNETDGGGGGEDDSGVGTTTKPTITSFTADTTSISAGSSVNLTAVFSNGTGVVDNDVGMVSSNVSVTVTPAVTTTYILIVTNTDGVTATQNVNVTVISSSNPNVVGLWVTDCYIQSADSVIESYNFIDGTNLETTVESFSGTLCAGTSIVETRKVTYQLGNTITTIGNKDAFEIDFVITDVDGIAIPVGIRDTYYQIAYIDNTENQMFLGVDDPVKDGSTPALRPDAVYSTNPLIRSSTLQVSAGGLHTCSVDAGEVLCWGENLAGQTTVPLLSNPRQVDVGLNLSCAVDDTGVVCWGGIIPEQTMVPTLSNPTQVSVGSVACALDDTGVVCWGHTRVNQLIPASFVFNNPIQISVNIPLICVLDDLGAQGNSVACWRLMANDPTIITTVPTLVNPTQISVGQDHMCALDDTGLVCWGDDTGHGEFTIPALNNPIEVSAGRDTTCVLDDNGTAGNSVVCWGRETDIKTIPTLINPTQISVGLIRHACAIDDTGIVCWGNNVYGQTTVP